MLANLFAAFCIGLFIWMLVTRTPSSKEDEERNRRRSGMVGFLGGDIEDAPVSDYALRRSEKKSGSADARAEATAASAKINVD